MYDVLLRLLTIQPADTFSQAVLQQVVALASVFWMSGEVKLADLRLPENVSSSLMKASVGMKVKKQGLPFRPILIMVFFPES